MEAATNNDCEIASLLLDRGADVNATDVEGRTALMSVEGPEVALVLVKGGANLEVEDEVSVGQALQCHTAEHRPPPTRVPWAACCGSAPQEGETCLMRAAQEGNAELVALLLDNGAASASVSRVSARSRRC